MISYPAGVIIPTGKRFRGSPSRAMVLAAVLLLGIGCGVRDPRLGQYGQFPQGCRWAAGDTSRLLRNAHYFKLMGQPEMALKELEEAHRLDPANLKVANALGQYYDELGLSQRAQQIYREALALDPDNPVLLNNLGFSYYLAGNGRQAETVFRQTLIRHPNNQAVRNNLGLLLCRQERREEARRLWREAAGEAAAAQKLGQALAALGMAEETRYAQQPRPLAEEQATRHDSSPGRLAGANPVTAAANPRQSQARAPAPSSPAPAAATPARPGKAISQGALASQPDPKGAADTTFLEKPRAIRPAPLTVRELGETHIAILNGNGIPHLAHNARSRLSQEGFNVVAIANFRDFGVDRTIIYYRPDSKHVATFLNNQFFPRAEIEPAPRLAGSIDVKIILGHDLSPQQHAEAAPQDGPKRL